MSLACEKMIADASDCGYVFHRIAGKIYLRPIRKGAKMTPELLKAFAAHRDELRAFVKGMFSAVRCVGCEMADRCGGECLLEVGGRSTDPTPPLSGPFKVN